MISTLCVGTSVSIKLSSVKSIKSNFSASSAQINPVVGNALFTNLSIETVTPL